MRRMYVPSRWLIDYKDDHSSRYYPYARYPLADIDLDAAAIEDCLQSHPRVDELAAAYDRLRTILVDHASCLYPALSGTERSDRGRLAREVLKMAFGVRMLRYRAYLMAHPLCPDSRETFDGFLERFDDARLFDDTRRFDPSEERDVVSC